MKRIQNLLFEEILHVVIVVVIIISLAVILGVIDIGVVYCLFTLSLKFTIISVGKFLTYWYAAQIQMV